MVSKIIFICPVIVELFNYMKYMYQHNALSIIKIFIYTVTYMFQLIMWPSSSSFFFYWRYNPLWVLAFSVIFFHCALSSPCFLHRLTPIICRSSSMPAIHLFRGLSLVLVPTGFHCNILREAKYK